jgi:hypothetical protein
MYGDRARVLVPDDADVQPQSGLFRERTPHVIALDQKGPNGRDQVHVRVFEQAITALQEQLTIANERACARGRRRHWPELRQICRSSRMRGDRG